MTSVEKTPYSLKNYNEINKYYNDYLRLLHFNDSTNKYAILNSIYPPLKNNNQQILFMPFLKEFIKGQNLTELNLETLFLPDPNDGTIPNFINYSIAEDKFDDDNMAEDDKAKRQIKAQEDYMKNSKNKNSFLANYKKIEDDIDESEEKPTKATKVKKGQQILEAFKDKTKNILDVIKNKFKDNNKLNIKQTAATQKALLAQEKTNAEIAITVFNQGLLSFETDSRNKFVIPPNLYSNPSAVALYDSLHDFGYEICDTETDKKGKENYGYSKFMFTYLLYGGYPELNNVTNFNLQDFQVNYSYLKAYTRPISPEGLENYFVIGNMYNIV